MTTYLVCKNCNQRFESPIQVENLDNPGFDIQNITLTCPICFKSMVLRKEDMFNE